MSGRYPHKTIWCYTGYSFEQDVLGRFLAQYDGMRDFLDCIDVMVDGEFILAKKDISLQFRGSSNQRIIDVKKSLGCGETVLWDGSQYFFR